MGEHNFQPLAPYVPKRNNTSSTLKSKEKVTRSSSIACTQLDDWSMQRFRTPEHKARFENVSMTIRTSGGRLGFEMTQLICLTGWKKVVGEPLKVYPTLV